MLFESFRIAGVTGEFFEGGEIWILDGFGNGFRFGGGADRVSEDLRTGCALLESAWA